LNRRLAIRIPLATLLSPPTAALCVAVLLSGWFWVERLSRGAEVTGATLGMFVEPVILFTMLGTVLFGPFTIAFALLTQFPLLLAYSRFGRPSSLLHLLVSAALGPPLLLGYFALLASMGPQRVELTHPLARSPDYLGGSGDLMLLAVGAAGGAAVGLVWESLVLGGLSRRNASNG
jgi:hypothetical protein